MKNYADGLGQREWRSGLVPWSHVKAAAAREWRMGQAVAWGKVPMPMSVVSIFQSGAAVGSGIRRVRWFFAICVSLLVMSQGTPPWKRSRPSWMIQPCIGSPVSQTAWSWRWGGVGRAGKRGDCTAANDGDDTAPCLPKRESGAESLRGRRDVPRLKPRARGSQSKALGIATCGSAVHAAEESLKRDMFAASTIGPKQSRLRLFHAIAQRAVGKPVYPLAVYTLTTVSGILKAAGYRSAHMYGQEAKLHHVELGHAWSSQLDRVAKLCKDSCLRGLGPPQKAGEIRLHEIADPLEITPALAEGGPMQTKRSWVVATFWLLREIELAGLRLHQSHVVVGDDWAELNLPVSKTDCGGLGKKRSLQCICRILHLADGGVPGKAVCPVCMLRRQVADISYVTGTSPCDVEALDVPLFPTCLGDAPSKEATVRAWRALVPGRPVGEEIGGHSARRSGAKLFSRCGWDLWKTQFHGRWGGEAVKGYTEEVFVEVAKNWHLEACFDAEGRAPLQKRGEAEMARVMRDIDAVAVAGEEDPRECIARVVAGVDVAEIRKMVHRELAVRPGFVYNIESNICHVVVSCNYETPVVAWATRCGWRFAQKGKYELWRAPPEGQVMCEHCAPTNIVAEK